MRPRRRVSQKKLDDLFPTIVRYAGVCLGIGLATAQMLGSARDFSSGYVLATMMILYKTVKGATNGDGD